MELDVFQLLTAWTWSEDFDLQRRFTELAEELRPHGFSELAEDTNLLLRCCAAIVGGDASPTAFISLKGADVRDRFDDIENGIKGAIDFLRKNMRVETLANLPYPACLVPLSVFFARKRLTLKDDQRKILVKWFWRSCFSRRYSAGVIRNLNRDIEEAANLREGRPSSLGEFLAPVDTAFFEQSFTIGTVNTRTFILLLAQQEPLSFVSGQSVTLSKVLQAYNRNEFHHLMPRAYLKGLDRETWEINALVNFAIIAASDNKTLGGVAPSEYKRHIPAAKLQLILDRSLCPDALFTDDFDQFVGDRSSRLLEAVRVLTAS